MGTRLIRCNGYQLVAMTIVIGLAHCLVTWGSSDAVEKFRQSRVVGSAQTFLEEGRRELERGAYLRAIRVLSAAINKGADPEALKLRGQAYDHIGAWEKSLEDFNRYVASNPSDPMGFVLRGDAYNANLHHERALQDYETALKLDPNSVQARIGRGLAYIGLEKYHIAVKEFRLLLQDDPNNSDLLTNLGIAYMLSDKPDAARDSFKSALEVEQDPQWRARVESWVASLPATADFEQATRDRDEDLARSQEPGGSSQIPKDLKEHTRPTEGQSAPPLHEGQGLLSRLPSAVGVPKYPPGYTPSSDLEDAPLNMKWDGTYLGARIRMQCQLAGQAMKGVLRIQSPMGKEDVYHFTGSFENGNVRASHGDGHVFRGKLTQDRRLVGTLTTADGRTIPVTLSAE
jgi:tetratricopeptide (TPR) repeat protein